MCVDAYVCVCMCLSCCNATTSVVVCGMIGGVVRSIHTSRSGELGPLERRYLCSLWKDKEMESLLLQAAMSWKKRFFRSKLKCLSYNLSLPQ